MNALTQADTPVVIESDGVEVRTSELGGGMSATFLRLPAGADLRPATRGLKDDLCQCPHWGYLLKGKIRMHTSNGSRDYQAGQAFYWAPGHAPEAIEATEYVDFSPTDEWQQVVAHITGQ